MSWPSLLPMSWPICNPSLGHWCYLCLGSAQEPRPTRVADERTATWSISLVSDSGLSGASPHQVMSAIPCRCQIVTRLSHNSVVTDPANLVYRAAMHLSYAFKLLRMSVLISGLQRLAIAAAVIAAYCSVALAQVPSSESTGQGLSPADADDQGPLSRVTVTGYVVPRIGEGPEPVTTLDQDFITKQGDQTVADILLRLPQNFAGFTPSLNAGQSTAEGGSAVNLYGLGANATLVLLDGRRQAT